MNISRILKLSHAFAQLILLNIFVGIQAQPVPTGALSGVVSNQATRSNLQGALIEVPALGRQVFSDSAGRFLLGNLPAGPQEIVITYTGLDALRQSVEIPAGGTTHKNFDLTSAVYRLEEFVVASAREGNAASITKQRNAINVVNVVATDTYGNVAEGNLGNFMQRLPGVATNNEVGDVTGIIVRGAPPSWNAVNIDGTRASSANGSSFIGSMGRGTVIDQIPPEFIEEIELTKALTPDMPADSIGGNANLITKSAFKIKGNLLSYRLAGNLNTYRRTDRNLTPSASITYLGKLGEREKVGLAVSASYTETNNTRDRIQQTRNTAAEYTTQARTLDDDIFRTRAGVSAKFEFKVGENTMLRIGGQYSYFEFDQIRSDWNITAGANRVADYNVVSRAAIEAGAVPRSTDNLAAGIAPGFSQEFTELLNANFSNTQGREYREANTVKFDVAGETKLPGEQAIDFSASYSPSEYDFTYSSMAVARNGRIGVAVDSGADKFRPDYVQTYGPGIGAGSSWSNVTSATLQSNGRFSRERLSDVNINYRNELSQFALRPEIKAGVDWRRQYRSFDTYFPRWNYNGPSGGASARDLTPYILPAPGYSVFNNRYPRRDELDYFKFLETFQNNPAQFIAQGTTVSDGTIFNNATETVSSAYAMGTVKAGKLTVLGGVRFESTDVKAVGRLIDPRNSGTTAARQNGKYDDVFPSLHLKYEPRRGFVIRGSVTTSMARPAHSDLYPNTTVSYDDNTGLGLVQQNNPALGPQHSTNYDLSAEYYFEPVGVISAGFFYKDLTDFIGREDQVIGRGSDNGFGGDFADFTLRTTRNFGSATIKGFELNYSQQLNMLPGLLKGLGIFANYTRIETEGQYDDSGADELVQFVPEMINAGLSWKAWNLNLAVKYNFQGGYLSAFNANPLARIRTTDTSTWDFNFRYQINRRLSVYMDVVNAFNKWPSWYTSRDPGRVVMSEVYGSRVSFGISGNF